MIKNLIILATIGMALNSCITSQKCNEKFPPVDLPSDTTTLLVDTVYIVKDVEVPIDPIDFYSDWWNFDQLPDTGIVLLPKQDVFQNGTASIETQGRKFKVNCKIDSLTAKIDSLKIKLSFESLMVNHYKQLFIDESQKLKQLKVEQKATIQSAKAEKWKQIKGVILYTFLLLAAVVALYLVIKYLR